MKAELLEYDTAYYGEQEWKDPYYLLKTLVTEMMQNLSDAAASRLVARARSFVQGYRLSIIWLTIIRKNW